MTEGKWAYFIPPGLCVTLLAMAFSLVGLRARGDRQSDAAGARMSATTVKSDTLLDVRDLRVAYREERPHRPDRRRRQLPAAPRRGARPGRRVGLRQDDHGARAARAAAERPAAHRRRDDDQLQARRDAAAPPHADGLARHALGDRVDGLPGRDERARSGHAHRPADRRGDRPARARRRSRPARRRAVRARRHPQHAAAAVSARVLRRHAAARDDRPGAGLQARAR